MHPGDPAVSGSDVLWSDVSDKASELLLLQHNAEHQEACYWWLYKIQGILSTLVENILSLLQ